MGRRGRRHRADAPDGRVRTRLCGCHRIAAADAGSPSRLPASRSRYATDALGLRSLDEAGKLRTLQYEGEHMRFSEEFWRESILPLLRDS